MFQRSFKVCYSASKITASHNGYFFQARKATSSYPTQPIKLGMSSINSQMQLNTKQTTGHHASTNIQKLKFKCIVVGSSQVGKTSLLKRLCENEFSSTTPTETTSYFGSRQFFSSPYKIDMDLWDTCGLHGFDALKSENCKDANIGIFVFDMNNRESLQQVTAWKQELIKHGQNDMIIGIAANKSEIYESGMIDMDEVNQALNTAEWSDAILLGTSARANVNVLELFFQTALKAAKQTKMK